MEDQSKEIERLRLQVKNLEKLSSLGMLSAGIDAGCQGRKHSGSCKPKQQSPS